MKRTSLIDFTGSFVTWKTLSGSYGRFQVEAFCSVLSPHSEKANQYYLLSGVFACDVYGKGRLFNTPPYFFQAVFSRDQHKIFRTYAVQKNNDSWNENNDVFSDIIFKIQEKESLDVSSDFSVLKAKTLSGGKLVCEIIREEMGYRMVFQFPVKHINLDDTGNRLQVETGPVLYFDIPADSQVEIRHAKRGYVAFNTLDAFEYLQQEERILESGGHIHFGFSPEKKDAQIKLYTYQ